MKAASILNWKPLFIYKNSCKHYTYSYLTLHGRRGSNSRHPVLETGALPTELLPFVHNQFPIVKPGTD